MKTKKARKWGEPILMKDGKVINRTTEDTSWIGQGIVDAISKEMKYVAKMNMGLATGCLSEDTEFCELRDRVFNDLIKERSIFIKKEIAKDAELNWRRLNDAHTCHDEVLQRMQSQCSQIADNNMKSFTLDEDGIYKVGRTGPISTFGPTQTYWGHIDLKKLGEEIKERIKKAKKMRKKAKAADKIEKTKKIKTKKATKKKTKKRVAKGDRK